MTVLSGRAVRLVVVVGVGLAMLAAVLVSPPVEAQPPVDDTEYFERIATYPVFLNNADPADETVAEIVDYWPGGPWLVYTDGELGEIGFVDISDPTTPTGGGKLDVGGEPTSVSVSGDYALVGVNTSPSFTAPSGKLVVVDLDGPAIVTEIELGGQPDSVDASPDGDYVAVVIENERDEDACPDGTTPEPAGDPETCLVPGGGEQEVGELPQAPPGRLEVVDSSDPDPTAWTTQPVGLTNLSAYAPSDPEPEFVDVNNANLAVVTLQENNHIVIVDLPSLAVVDDFPAGDVNLQRIDATEDDLISFTDNLRDLPREPDAVTWVSDSAVATANEGDLFGGSRGFSIFDLDHPQRATLYDSGSSFDELARDIGHYNEGRSENKGSEPESITRAVYGSDDLVFVGAERGSFVGVYDIESLRRPELVQALPTGLGPEGLLAIPDEDLFVVSSEVDDPEFGVRATIMIYQRGATEPAYPDVMSDGIGWSAMSGMVADATDPSLAYAVWDSFYAESKVFTLDVSQTPARVIDERPVLDGRAPVGYDLEGIALDGDGGYWVVSEGAVSGSLASTPNLLIHLDRKLNVVEEIGLPADVVACRQAMIDQAIAVDDEDSPEYAAARNLRFGFEGVTVDDEGIVHVAQQRGWEFDAIGAAGVDDCSNLSGDNGGGPGEVGVTKVWSYDPDAGTWSSTDYELDPRPADASWVGLSEITFVGDGGDGAFVFIERDNRTGVFATVKTLTQVDAVDVDGETITAREQMVFDLLPAMTATNGWISDKPEGVAVTADGQTYVITDNDGVDDWSGETQLLRLGDIDDDVFPNP